MEADGDDRLGLPVDPEAECDGDSKADTPDVPLSSADTDNTPQCLNKALEGLPPRQQAVQQFASQQHTHDMTCCEKQSRERGLIPQF
eukprot:superscaffoldBa00007641_g22710